MELLQDCPTGAGLQGSEAQYVAAVTGQEEVNEPVAQSANAVKQDDLTRRGRDGQPRMLRSALATPLREGAEKDGHTNHQDEESAS